MAGGAPGVRMDPLRRRGAEHPLRSPIRPIAELQSRLIRASITDITERKRAEAIAAGERRVFEKIAANAPLSAALEAICEVIERVMAESCCAIDLLDHERQALNFGVAPHLPREFVAAMDGAPVAVRYGSSAAAVYLARQITVADVETDALWEFRREAAMHAGLRAAWSAPIMASDGRVIGTFAVYRRQAGVPLSKDHELMMRIGADRRNCDRAALRGGRGAQQRGEIPRPVRKHDGGGVPDFARRAHPGRKPRLREPDGL